MRLGAIFVAVCMTVIAVSAGAVVYFAYGFTGADAIIVAIAALTALAFLQCGLDPDERRIRGRPPARRAVPRQRRSGAPARRDGATAGGGRSPGMERSLAKGEAAIEPLAVEISELGTLIDQLAETVAIHETQLRRSRCQRRAGRAGAVAGRGGKAGACRARRRRGRQAGARQGRRCRPPRPRAAPPAVTVARCPPAVVPAVGRRPMPGTPRNAMAAPRLGRHRADARRRRRGRPARPT